MDRRNFLKSAGLCIGGATLAGSGLLVSSCASSPGVNTRSGMQYRRLGNTGLDVAVISLGCEGFFHKSPGQVREEFDFAVSRGINFLDLYASDPELRSAVGYAIKGRRNKFVIQGHICSCWEDGQYLRTREIDKVRASFEDELQRLGTNYIDIGMIHYIDDDEDFDTVFNGPVIEYVRELKRKRVIRHIGLSTHTASIARRAVETGEVEVIMFSLNPGYDMDFENGGIKGVNPERQALYELCESRGVGLDVMKAFSGGNLLDAQNSPFGKALTPVQCIEYALTRPGVAAVMCGADGLDQLKSDLDWLDASKGERDFAAVLASSTGADWRGHCTYCTHCAPCSAGIDIAMVNKFLYLAQAGDSVPETVIDHYNNLDHHASECTDCGKCMTRCPFGVPVTRNMAKAARIFGL